MDASGLDTIEEEEAPFDSGEKNLLLKFSDWRIRVLVESGATVCDDYRVISGQLVDDRQQFVQAEPTSWIGSTQASGRPCA